MASTREMQPEFPVRNVQIALQALAAQYSTMVPPIPDGIYGPVTAQAITVFQEAQGLPPTGDTDRETWDALHSAYFRWLHQQRVPAPLHLFPDAGAVLPADAEDDAVYAVQLILRRIARQYADFRPVTVTGQMDSDTVRELQRFQARALLPETGEADRETWDRLVRFYALPEN
ncbi:MAG: peptidoglycan-binding protein [Clostridia bacterium]|nr:peptidoglycan-binding protein [Clostridia bacterium]